MYSSPDVINIVKLWIIIWGEIVDRVGEMRNAYTLCTGTPERNSLFGRHRRSCENDIKVDVKEIRYKNVDWIGMGPVDWCCIHGNKLWVQ